MVPEARLRRTEHGLRAESGGWFVLNARDAVWHDAGRMGVYTRLGEGAEDGGFDQVGVNVGVLWPGQPSCMYHREPNQEGFLVVSGECLLLVEEEERTLRAWDFFHCPPETAHVLVGAGDGPCVVVAVGSRASRGVVYPESDLARRRAAGVERETASGREAYAGLEEVEIPCRDGFLPPPSS